MSPESFARVADFLHVRPEPAVEVCPGLWLAEGSVGRVRPDSVDIPVAVTRETQAAANAVFQAQVLVIARAWQPILQQQAAEARTTADRLDAVLVALAAG